MPPVQCSAVQQYCTRLDGVGQSASHWAHSVVEGGRDRVVTGLGSGNLAGNADGATIRGGAASSLILLTMSATGADVVMLSSVCPGGRRSNSPGTCLIGCSAGFQCDSHRRFGTAQSNTGFKRVASSCIASTRGSGIALAWEVARGGGGLREVPLRGPRNARKHAARTDNPDM